MFILKKTDDVDEHALFDYGPPAGDPLVRRQLAEFLKNQYNDDVDRLVELNVRERIKGYNFDKIEKCTVCKQLYGYFMSLEKRKFVHNGGCNPRNTLGNNCTVEQRRSNFCGGSNVLHRPWDVPSGLWLPCHPW